MEIYSSETVINFTGYKNKADSKQGTAFYVLKTGFWPPLHFNPNDGDVLRNVDLLLPKSA
jgi:hypothetical protein